METVVPQEKLLELTVQCKPWSGKFLSKIFNRTGVPGYELGSLGSAGFLKYKERFFVVTCTHVIKAAPIDDPLTELVVPYKFEEEAQILKFLRYEEDKNADISILEVNVESSMDMIKDGVKLFIEADYIEENPLNYLEERSNIVFLHGISGEETDINYEDFIVDMTTTPYTTFIDRVDQDSQRIVLLVDPEGINEYGENRHPLPQFNGMSGSFAYSYRLEDEQTPFRLLGVLSNGHRDAGQLWVIPFNEVIDVLERFFEEETDIS